VISFKYQWEREYVAAILETDDERLAARIFSYSQPNGRTERE